MTRIIWFPRLTFRAKISISIIAILLLFGTSLTFIISMTVSEALLRENRLRGVSNAVNLSARVIEPLLSIDFLALRNLVHEIINSILRQNLQRQLSFVFGTLENGSNSKVK